MSGKECFTLNFNSLSDSKASSLSAVQDLNSASSLSWAEDEVENSATLRVNHCLFQLEEYLAGSALETGNDQCFDLAEAEEWRNLITNFNLAELLQNSRRITRDDTKLNPVKKKQDVRGRSFAHSLSASKQERMNDSGFNRTPRTRSAYPLKSSGINSSFARLGGTRSSNVNQRFPSSLSHSKTSSDYLKILDDTSNLTLNRNKESAASASKNYIPLRRTKLQPVVTKFEDAREIGLPLLPDVKTPGRSRSKSKFPSPNVLPPSQVRSPSQKWVNVSQYSVKRVGIGSPASRNNAPVIKAAPTFHNSKHEVEVSIIGTSFDPVVRPVRNKFRMNM